MIFSYINHIICTCKIIVNSKQQQQILTHKIHELLKRSSRMLEKRIIFKQLILTRAAQTPQYIMSQIICS